MATDKTIKHAFDVILTAMEAGLAEHLTTRQTMDEAIENAIPMSVTAGFLFGLDLALQHPADARAIVARLTRNIPPGAARVRDELVSVFLQHMHEDEEEMVH